MASARRSRRRPCARSRPRAAQLAWERADAGAGAVAKHGDPLPQATIESIKRNQLALKGPLATPSGGGYRSVNVTLRQQFDLYANVRPAKTIAGVPSRYTNVDLVIVRENTEDLYAGVEHYVDPRRTAAESIAIITRFGSERVIIVRVRVRARARPQEGHARPQGEHPEDVERPVPRHRQRDREDAIPTSSSTT